MEPSEKKNLYEITFHTLTEEGAGKVRLVIEKSGGNVVHEKPVQKIRLAYKVKKQLFGFTSVTGFEMEPAKIHGFSNELALAGCVLRSMIHIVSPKKERTKEVKKSSVETTQPIQESGTKLRSFTTQTLSNEALEKKIEEILQ
ncbi:MAG: 30S ribosomal protein S6 [Patescibacteria group bacterium]